MEEKMKAEKIQLEKDRKIFQEQQKSLELSNSKLSMRISELELQLNNQVRKTDKDFSTEKKY